MGKSAAKTESSKSDKKLEKKLEFYTKVKDTVSSLKAGKTINKKKKLRSRQKKLKAFDLSALSEFLPDVKGSQKPTPASEFKLNCKSRQKLIAKEHGRLSIVLNDSAFRNDPIAAIHRHLQSTQPVFDEKPKKRVNKNGKKKKKKGSKSKASSEPQSMDM